MENCTLSSVCELINGVQYLSSKIEELPKNKGYINVIKMSNLNKGMVNNNNLCSVNLNPKRLTKYFLKKDDILLSAKATSLSISRITDNYIRKTIPYSNLLLIRPNPEKVNPVYLFYYLNQKEIKSKIFELGKGRTPTKMFSAKLLSDFELILPSMEKQNELAKRLLAKEGEKDNLERKRRKINSEISIILKKESGK